jgi:hypothetical protein
MSRITQIIFYCSAFVPFMKLVLFVKFVDLFPSFVQFVDPFRVIREIRGPHSWTPFVDPFVLFVSFVDPFVV